ncbi:hypothetical protein RhiirA1_436033 [Rhizophagus irregularis]|uniref:ASX DEUBAD domain-containing protein n=1 Tax=Rhizophagus irregularis TaxID=588596 RepID=A0A2N0SJQ6_9GLOM|nr:hypothetical protein RhiirA1_436033 [Rhizophagus irregularis]CAB4487177.1 unnamed protein product [Rhizophagus irregularis]
MPKKRNNTKSSTSVRRSTRIKRKDEQLLKEAAFQEVYPEYNKETQPAFSLYKKRAKSFSPVHKSKKVRNEDEKQQQIEEMKMDVIPYNDSQESETIKRSNKGKNKVIEPYYEDNIEVAPSTSFMPVVPSASFMSDAPSTSFMSDAPSTSFMSDAPSASFMSLKSLFNEKLSMATSSSNIPKYDGSDTMNIDETDSIVQEKWEKIKAQLFEVPREPFPEYHDYQERMFTRQPWMKKKDVDYLQKLFSDPKSMVAKKQLKSLFNFQVYNKFSDEQKSRLLKLIPNCELVPIASDNGEPIDTPRIEREYTAAGKELYMPGVSEPVKELDPNKVCPRFDFWLSDSFKDARWWFQTSVRYGYNTSYGVDTQWDNLENFKTKVPKNWKSDDYEQEWGLGLWGKLGKKQVAGDSAKISLPEMAKAQIIRLNDTLKYKRQFKNIGITVLMDLKVVGINKSNGHLKLELFKGEQSKTIDGINNPTRLENEVLDFDGRVAKSSRPNGNAFKNFSIARSGDYSPSLFEARKEYWAKNQ